MMGSYKCTVCGYIYNPVMGDPENGITPGTPFEELPADWTCPICLTPKKMFEKEEGFSLGDQKNGLERAKHLSMNTNGDYFTMGEDNELSTYKERFENLSRVAKRISSSLSIGNILEIIRDEAKVTIPHAQEACLLVLDPEALHYTRPLHCAVYKDRINCQLCKRGREAINGALEQPLAFQCSLRQNGAGASLSDSGDQAICEVALPVFDGKQPLGVLDVIVKEGHSLDPRDITLLKDLGDLATNAIINARNHWKITQEKLTIDSILGHLKPFVPETVQQIVEKDPFDPSLAKRDLDVSILFLDIAGYTKISESLSRDKLDFIIEKYFSSFLDVIYKRQGDINETAGDGLMVIFHGDARENALNACRSALDIRIRMLEINKELKGRFEPVEVNMGINSGIASVGMTRFHGAAGTRTTYTATGPVTNLAARIASAAREGDILVGAETAARIEEELPLYDRGPMLFKNVQEEVHVYSLIR